MQGSGFGIIIGTDISFINDSHKNWKSAGKNWATSVEILGGMVLIAIGIKIFVEHTM